MKKLRRNAHTSASLGKAFAAQAAQADSLAVAWSLLAAVVQDWDKTLPSDQIWERLVAARLLDTLGALATPASITAARRAQPLLVRGAVEALRSAKTERASVGKLVDLVLNALNEAALHTWPDPKAKVATTALTREALYLQEQNS